MSAFDKALAEKRSSNLLYPTSTNNPAPPTTNNPAPPTTFLLTPASARHALPDSVTLRVYETQTFSRLTLKWSFPSPDPSSPKLLTASTKKRPSTVPRYHSSSGKPSISMEDIDGPGPNYMASGNWKQVMNVIDAKNHIYGDGWEYSSCYASLLSGKKQNGSDRKKRYFGKMRDVYRRREWIKVFVKRTAREGGEVIAGKAFVPPSSANGSSSSNSFNGNGARRRTSTEDSCDPVKLQIQAQLVQVDADLMTTELIMERDTAIRHINKDMVTLNQAFKDVAHLVESQQDDITALESNMEESHEVTKRAVAELEEAARYQRSSQCVIS
jgi:hypothetical protein